MANIYFFNGKLLFRILHIKKEPAWTEKPVFRHKKRAGRAFAAAAAAVCRIINKKSVDKKRVFMDTK